MSKNIIEIPLELESKTLEWVNAQNYLQSEIHYYYIKDYVNKYLPELGFTTIEDDKDIWYRKDENFEIRVVISISAVVLVWIKFERVENHKRGFVNRLSEPSYKFYYILQKLNYLLIQMQEQKTNE